MGGGGEPGRGLDGSIEDGVEPVEGGLEVEIVPEAVAVDEGVWASGLFRWEEAAQAVELVGGDGEADHLFDLDGMVNWASSMNGGKCLLMTSILSAGHARLSGSFLATSDVLKMPWTEQDLTLNW